MHRTTPPSRHLRVVVAALLALVATAGVGCGGKADRTATFSVADVQRQFQALAGLRLEPVGGRAAGDPIELSVGGSVDDSLGLRVVVLRTKAQVADFTEFPLEEDAAVNHNVHLVGDGGTGLTGRAARIVRSLGTSPEDVALLAADVPCARAGVDPDGGTGPTGTCRSGEDVVDVAGADESLELPTGGTMTLLGVQERPTVRRRSDGDVEGIRARGTFLLVRVRVRVARTGSSAEEPDATLFIGGREYAESLSNSDVVDPERYEDYPVRPGHSAETTYVFDLPASAGDPRTQGALAVRGATATRGEDGLPTEGRLRLVRPIATAAP